MISQLKGLTSGGVVACKTGRREVPVSNLGRACRRSRSMDGFMDVGMSPIVRLWDLGL